MTLEGLKDGTAVLLREPTMDDLERSRRFFLSLTPEDQRYLRIDATRPEVVERRIRQAELGEIYRIVAIVDDQIVADGVLEVAGGSGSWSRHIGEIRVIVAPKYRGQRLGALIIGELFRGAQERGCEKVVAKMVAPQTTARTIFDRLGFRVDAVLPGDVKDVEGNLHDLIVMSCTLDEVWRELKDFYRKDDWPDG